MIKFNKPYILAEAGVNHNGSLETAVKMVKVAKEAGADAIKFQTFKTEDLVTKEADMADYQKTNLKQSSGSQFDMLKKLELSRENHFSLLDECNKYGIDFVSSPFSDSDAKFLMEELKLSTVKIGSGEITNLKMLKSTATYKKHVILSTGMSNLEEIKWALGAIYLGLKVSNLEPNLKNCLNASNGEDYLYTLQKHVTLLHCTSNYPAPLEELNLKAIKTLTENFKLNIGFSDHSDKVWPALTAIGVGAVCFEKHFTLDKNMSGPDHKASIEPEMLKNYIDGIQSAFLAMGNGLKKPQASEEKTKLAARKSVVAIKAIKAGDLFSLENTALKRPGSGLEAQHYYDLVGKKSNANYDENTLIEEAELGL